MIAFFDELRAHGFAEGENLAIIPKGFEAGNGQIDELVPALVKAAPDAIIAGGDVIPRALQSATRTIPIVVITEDMVAAGFALSTPSRYVLEQILPLQPVAALAVRSLIDRIEEENPKIARVAA
jgi:ABC-type uncharacterized transport system substrate-binding protein